MHCHRLVLELEAAAKTGKSQPTGQYLPQAVGFREGQAWPGGAVTSSQTLEVGSDPILALQHNDKEPRNKAPA